MVMSYPRHFAKFTLFIFYFPNENRLGTMVLLFWDFIPSYAFMCLCIFLSFFFFKSLYLALSSVHLFVQTHTNTHSWSCLLSLTQTYSTHYQSVILSLCLPLTHIHTHTLTNIHYSCSNTVKREARIEWQFLFSLLSLSLFFSLKKESCGPKPSCIN